MTDHGTDLPSEFDIPEHAAARHLSLLEQATRRRAEPKRKRPTVAAVAAIVTLSLVLVTAVAVAATTGLFDRDVTAADLDERATFVARTVVECQRPQACASPRQETVKEVRLTPADGVTFVDPAGHLIVVTPANGTVTYESRSEYGRELSRSRDGDERHAMTVALPDGGTRTIAFTVGEGVISVTDRPAGTRRATTTTLESGDVVPLIPGALADEVLTPDKAVTVDIADGKYQVWIYPTRNVAYVGGHPWQNMGRETAIPPDIARRYALIASEHGAYAIPVRSSGGRWSYALGGGVTRTVSWNAGDSFITIVDRKAAGAVGQERLRTGRRVNGG